MKNIFIICIFSIFCIPVTSLSQKNHSSLVEEKYKIVKIDSINNYYLVIAKRNDSLFKIVSEKIITENNTKIKKGEKYPIILFSIKDNPSKSEDGVILQPINFYDIDCYSYDDSTKICLKRRYHYELYHTNNLRGLSFYY